MSKRSVLWLGLVAAILTPGMALASACPRHYAGGVEPRIERPAVARLTREVCYDVFVVMHSGQSRGPLWSAEHLTAQALAKARQLKRTDSFHPEPSLPHGERAELSDYARSGYDRGHLSPNADMPDVRAQAQSFSLANMIPQWGELNRGVWSSIESETRALAKRRGELFVVTGPIFSGRQIKQIGGRVMVPTQVFKLIYDPRANRAGVYVAENSGSDSVTVISVTQLEQLTGIDFLPGVSASVKSAVMQLPAPTPRDHRQAYPRDRAASFPDDMEKSLRRFFQ